MNAFKDKPIMLQSILVLLIIGLAACDQGGPDDAVILPGEAAVASGDVASAKIAPEVRRQLAALRGATARYHRAPPEGYIDVTGCRENPPVGGMGFHYAEPPFDAVLSVTEPEALLYEPQRNGQLRLVGVEFIKTGSETDPRPVFMGEHMHWNTEFGVWTLHAWVWKHNPSGMFADWNPTVSCEHAEG